MADDSEVVAIKRLELGSLSNEQLVDRFGEAKALVAEAKDALELVNDEVCKRWGKGLRLGKSRTAEGVLFRVTVTKTEKISLDSEAIRAYLGKKIAQFERRSKPFLTVRCYSRKGTDNG